MRVQELPAAEVAASLHSGPDGLGDDEAARRLAEYGPNRVERVRTAPLWRRFADQFTHLFALVLWAAAALAAVVELRRPGEGMGMLALAIVLVVAVNGLFSFWQEYRSERALEGLRRLLPHRVRVVRGGRHVELPAEHLVPGDRVLLGEGDAIAADCRVVRAVALQVDLSAVTGESAAVARDAEPDPHAEAFAARNILPAGASVVSGEAEAVVFATGMRTMLGAIAHITQTAGGEASPLQRQVAHLSRVITLLAGGMGVAFLGVALALGMSIWQSALFAIGLMVANVPEGLLPTVTLALAMAAQRLARRNVLVRRLTAVETLGAASVICTDKTGTLTENRMVARRVMVAGRLLPAEAVAEVGEAGRRLLATAARCHSLDMVEGRPVGDPTEIALVALAGGPAAGEAIDGLAFDAARRRMSLLFAEGGGFALHAKGALDALLPLATTLLDQEGERPLSASDREALRKAEAAMADAGLRVLALAWRPVAAGTPKEEWERELVLLGLVGLEDPPRPEVAPAVAQCRRAGIKVVMVTGDHPRTAEAIARQVGLTTGPPRVITGERLARMSQTQLQLALDAPEIIFARTRADQKWRIVKALQAKGEVVAVTGDGVNDAPAIKQADIGIAMGASGTDVAREAADMVLLDDNFATIVAAIEEGRTVYENIRKFMTYILTSNVPEIVPYLAFAAFDAPLALTVAQILAVDLGTDMLPALALAAEPPRRDVMDRPPRRRGERLVGRGLLGRAYGFLGSLQAVAAMTIFFWVLTSGGWRWALPLEMTAPLYQQATTACLIAIVLMQVVNLFACRSRTLSVFHPHGRNRLIGLGIAFEIGLLLLIVFTNWGNRLFGTQPPPAGAWLAALAAAGLLLLAEEARKAVLRR